MSIKQVSLQLLWQRLPSARLVGDPQDFQLNGGISIKFEQCAQMRMWENWTDLKTKALLHHFLGRDEVRANVSRKKKCIVRSCGERL